MTAAAVAGLMATPHCAAMCGTPCSAVCAQAQGRSAAAWWSFALARLASYAVAGALAAAVVSALAEWSALSRVLAPAWTALQWAAVALALWWLATGRQPAFLMRLGRNASVETASRSGEAVVRWKARSAWRPAAAGSLWALWPCGVLQSSLMLAALAPTVASGAAVMALFAVASMPGLWWVHRAWQAAGAQSPSASQWPLRLAGVVVLATLLAGWAGHTAPKALCWY